MLDAHITQIMRSVYVKAIALSQKLCTLLETLSLLTERGHPCCLKLSQRPRPPAVQTFHLWGAANQKTSSIKGTVALKGGRSRGRNTDHVITECGNREATRKVKGRWLSEIRAGQTVTEEEAKQKTRKRTFKLKQETNKTPEAGNRTDASSYSRLGQVSSHAPET